MVVISGIGPVPMPAPVSRAGQDGSPGFTVPRPAGGDARPMVAQTGMATSISGSMMLAMQEQVGRDRADEEGRRHGRRLLDELTRLQRALLSNGDTSSLEALEALAKVQPEDVDPALAGVLASIRLRARVELERRARRPGLV